MRAPRLRIKAVLPVFGQRIATGTVHDAVIGRCSRFDRLNRETAAAIPSRSQGGPLVRILVALGSSMAAPVDAVGLGWRAVRTGLELRDPSLSGIVRSRPAEGATGQPFANAVGAGDCDLEPLAILRILQRIERAFGRDRVREGWHGARPLDLDLLDVGGRLLDHPDLCLPHPRLPERDFVLVPLAQVAPDFVDARSGRTVADLIARLATRNLL